MEGHERWWDAIWKVINVVHAMPMVHAIYIVHTMHAGSGSSWGYPYDDDWGTWSTELSTDNATLEEDASIDCTMHHSTMGYSVNEALCNGASRFNLGHPSSLHHAMHTCHICAGSQSPQSGTSTIGFNCEGSDKYTVVCAG